MTEFNSGNTVVLIDMHTRKAVESIAYDALSKYVTVITDIREINESNYESDVVIFEPAVPAIVTPEILREQVAMYSIKPHLIYSIDEIGKIFSDVADLVKANYSIIEWNLVYAVLNKDLAVLEPYQRMKQEPFEFATLIESLNPEAAQPVERIYRSYLTLAQSYNQLVTKNAELYSALQIQQSINAKSQKAIEELEKLLDEATQMNRTFCAMLSESYDVTFNGTFPDKPRVLYIKSISHLSGIDNLLMILYTVLIKQYKVSCKIIKLVDQANAVSLRYTPNAYVPLTDSYNTYEVLTNDFLMVLGGYNVLMNLLMMNRSGLDFLIVHDMRGTLGYALDDSLVDLKIHEMSGDYAVLGEYENVLTDMRDKGQFYWNFAEVSNFSGTETSKLVNHPTVGHILDYLL